MAFTRVSFIAALAALCLAAVPGGTGAASGANASTNATPATHASSPVQRTGASIWRAGLWNKPNEACIRKCEVFVNKDCFTELSKKNPSADPASIQFQCEDKFSMCLYDCMCDTCDENQIIIKEP